MEKLAGGEPVANCMLILISRRIIHDLDRPLADKFTDADKKAFQDPEYYKTFRWELEAELNVSSMSLLTTPELTSN